MNHQEILGLPLDQISVYVEEQVRNGGDRVAVIKEIASARRDVTLLSLKDDRVTFEEKIKQALTP
ncbi:MAG: hypothetical protein ACFB4I_21405 [Cyanophyceae cyanobacterium]